MKRQAAQTEQRSVMPCEGVTGKFILDETGTPEKSVAVIEFKDGEAVWNCTLD